MCIRDSPPGEDEQETARKRWQSSKLLQTACNAVIRLMLYVRCWSTDAKAAHLPDRAQIVLPSPFPNRSLQTRSDGAWIARSGS
eukprot:3587700-Alexandrium_andersonii.AAC.1